MVHRGKNPFRVNPAFNGKKRVRADNKIHLIIRIFFMEIFQRAVRAGNFPFAWPHMSLPGSREPLKPQALSWSLCPTHPLLSCCSFYGEGYHLAETRSDPVQMLHKPPPPTSNVHYGSDQKVPPIIPIFISCHLWFLFTYGSWIFLFLSLPSL